MLDLNRRLLLDGGMGTMLQGSGLEPGQAPETLNLTNPAAVEAVHAAYAAAGADIITANTFAVRSWGRTRPPISPPAYPWPAGPGGSWRPWTWAPWGRC